MHKNKKRQVFFFHNGFKIINFCLDYFIDDNILLLENLSSWKKEPKILTNLP